MNGARTDHQESRADGESARQEHRARSSGNAVRWVAAAISAAALFIGVLSMFNAAAKIGRPFPGFLLLRNRLVVSVARPDWGSNRAPHIFFAEAVGVESPSVADAGDVERHVASLPVGTPVSYRFRKHGELFNQVLPLESFSFADYLSVYLTYLVVGLSFLGAGLWAVWSAPEPSPARRTFFAFAATVAVVLFTAIDVYGPYRFTSLYFVAQSFTPAFLCHFASSFPSSVGRGSPLRRVTLALLYALSAAMGVGFTVVENESFLFVPLLYSMYLLTANAGLLYFARLVVEAWSTDGPTVRESLQRALSAAAVAVAVPAVFVVYPVLDTSISPVFLCGPLALFAVLTASALPIVESEPPVAGTHSVRVRLVLLFLGAVQTAFFVGVALFWLDESRERLLDDLHLKHHRLAQVEQFLTASSASAGGRLAALERSAEETSARLLAQRAEQQFRRGDLAAARAAVTQLGRIYAAEEDELQQWRSRIGRFATTLVIGLVLGGIAQAVTFTVAVRRWLILPLERLSAATSVIATGDLSHRVEVQSTDELGALARSVNSMAGSLAEIQTRIDAEREARHRAAGTARDAERRRLARELHDSVLQDLGALKLRLESEPRQSPGSDLQPAIEAVVTVINEMRRVVEDLRPADLGHVPLGEAIETYARGRADGARVGLQTDLAADALVPDWTARDVYRIAQEAVTNALRHGDARNIGIYLYQRGDAVVLEIYDDGAGFDLDTAVLGSGILGMRERAAAIGGDLEITSVRGEGTMVELTLPIAPPAARADGHRS